MQVMCQFNIIERQHLSIVIVVIVVSLTAALPGTLITEYNCTLTCHAPQPRSIRLFNFTNFPGVIPYMTVLYRCDEGTGCCTRGKICAIAKSEDVEITVLVPKNKKLEKHTFLVQNHTQCSCQNINDIIK